MGLTAGLAGGGGGGGGANLLVMIKAIDQASAQLQKVSKEITGVGQAGKQASSGVQEAEKGTASFTSGLKALGTAAIGVTAAIGTAALAFRELMQAGEEGAAVTQATQSFQTMMKSVNADVDLLSQLRAAARGTIPDMQLMSYATTALAGASGEFGSKMAENLPLILEIAKAAQKANPALGSVDYQFESLIVGLKRLSPRLIDNTGLQIKLGQAYETYAKSLGKSREELTSTEQQMALMNAVLEAGGILMKQVGGSAESLTDPFERMKSSWTNLTNLWKSQAAPALSGIADQLSKFFNSMSGVGEQAFKQQQNAIADTTNSYEKYFVEAIKAAEANKLIAKGDAEMAIAAMENRDGVAGLSEEYLKLSHIQLLVKVATGELTVAQMTNIEAYQNSAFYIDGMAKSLNLSTEATFDLDRASREDVSIKQEVIQATSQARIAADEYATAQATLKEQIEQTNEKMALQAGLSGKISQLQKKYTDDMKGLVKEHKDLEDQLNKTIGGTTRMTAAYNFVSNVLNGSTGPAYDKFRKQSADLLETHQKLVDQIGDATKKYGAQSQQVDDLNLKLVENERALALAAEHGNLTEQLKKLKDEGYSPTSKAIKDLTDKLAENEQKQKDAADAAKKAAGQFIYEQIAAKLDTASALDLAKAMGLIDQPSYDAAKSANDVIDQFDILDGKMGNIADQAKAMPREWQAALEMLKVLQTRLEGIPATISTDITITTTYKSEGESTNYAGGPPNGDYKHYYWNGHAWVLKGGSRQIGGGVFQGSAYLVGEAGPEMFIPTQSGAIVSNQAILDALRSGGRGGPSVNVYASVGSDIDINILAYKLADIIYRRNR